VLTRHQGLYKFNGLIAVPDCGNLRHDIIHLHHAPPSAGHGGVAKTCKSLVRTFWWPGWRRDVKAFVVSCDSCQRNKSSTLKPAGLLQPLDIPERRWEHVTMDLITCLPKTKRGHDAILVFVDKLTKMTHFAATTSNASAQDVAQLFIDRVVCLHGVPHKIITDRDKRFTGQFFQAVCQALDTSSVQSSAFHPQTDGQTERMNRVLEDTMRHYVSADHSDWDLKLSLCEFAINGSVQASTGNTPFFLNYGQEPLTPLTVHTDLVVPSARVFAEKLQQAIKQAKLSLEQAVQRQKAYADSNRRDVQFKDGDTVRGASCCETRPPRWLQHPPSFPRFAREALQGL
jgi:Integrase zinc binding domain